MARRPVKARQTTDQARGRAADRSHGQREPGLGHDRIVGALANLGYKISDQTVGNVLQRHALPPAPERKRTTTWPAFIQIGRASCRERVWSVVGDAILA